MADKDVKQAGGASRRLQKPKGLMRRLLRAPIWLYRHGLGRLMGKRFIMLEHTGRKSGKPRYTVVEVVHHDRATGEYIIASGWGERADWYRNIRKTPEVVVDTGRERVDMTARRLPEPAAGQELLAYAQRHPAAFRALSRIMTGEPAEATPEGCARMAAAVPIIRLVPREQEVSG